MFPSPDRFFLPYQNLWRNDTSPLRICEKGRQVGVTYVDEYDSVLKAAVKRGKDVWVVSRDESQAKQYIAGCKRWARALGYATSHYGEQIFTLANGNPVKVQVLTFANPIARIAYALYKGAYINTVSVGFIPIRWEDGQETAPHRRRYLEQELVEVSAVPIPANPNALTLALKSGAIERASLAETIEILRSAGPTSPTRPTLVPLLQALHRLLIN